jgi:hypothetical protein
MRASTAGGSSALLVWSSRWVVTCLPIPATLANQSVWILVCAPREHGEHDDGEDVEGVNQGLFPQSAVAGDYFTASPASVIPPARKSRTSLKRQRRILRWRFRLVGD